VFIVAFVAAVDDDVTKYPLQEEDFTILKSAFSTSPGIPVSLSSLYKQTLCVSRTDMRHNCSPDHHRMIIPIK
jgi:hypothetical protein